MNYHQSCLDPNELVVDLIARLVLAYSLEIDVPPISKKPSRL